MKRISQLFLVSIVGVFVVFFALGQSPVMAQDSPQGVNLELEVDWPSIPGIGTLNDLVSDGLTLNELIVFVYTFLLWLSIILAFLALIYAGFLYVVSGANPSARSRAFDYVKRIVTGGTILLLTVLILSFINTDLVEIEDGVAVNAYCQGPNRDECKRKIRDGGHLVAQSYNVDSGAFEYEIRTTSVQDMERRLIDIGVTDIKDEIEHAIVGKKKPGITASCIENDNNCYNPGSFQNQFSSEGFACPIGADLTNACGGNSDESLCSVLYTFCSQGKDINSDGRISEADFRNTNLLNILTALCEGSARYGDQVPRIEKRNAEVNKSVCRWEQLNELITKDKTKYEDNAGDVSVQYVLAQDDDAAPSCAARCVYNDPNQNRCPEYGGSGNFTNLKCNNWGDGEEDNNYQRDKKPLKLESVNTNTTPPMMCKVKQGVSDDDFKRDYNGRERAKCAATYVADSFIVPLVEENTRDFYLFGVNVSPVIIKKDGGGYVDGSTLYGCYCQQP